jgi:hypothetical protein
MSLFRWQSHFVAVAASAVFATTALAAANVFPPFLSGDPIVPAWGNLVVAEHHEQSGNPQLAQIPAASLVYTAQVDQFDFVVSWEHGMPPDPSIAQVGAAGFDLGGPQDMTGAVLSFRLTAPPQAQSVFVELNDLTGQKRGWLRVGATASLELFTIALGVSPLAEPQPPYSFFHTDPGFDVSQVTHISAGAVISDGVGTFPPDPSGAGDAWFGLNAPALPVPALSWLGLSGLVGALLAAGWWSSRNHRNSRLQS